MRSIFLVAGALALLVSGSFASTANANDDVLFTVTISSADYGAAAPLDLYVPVSAAVIDRASLPSPAAVRALDRSAVGRFASKPAKSYGMHAGRIAGRHFCAAGGGATARG